MLKTAEIESPGGSGNLHDSRFLLYEAFSRIVGAESVKNYPLWRKEANQRWIGGVTAGVGLSTLADLETSVVFRESSAVLQLLVSNASAEDRDRASDFQANGWETPVSHPSTLINVVLPRRGAYKDKIIAFYNHENLTPVRYKDGVPGDPVTDAQAREFAFLELVRVIRETRVEGYPDRRVLTSPVWRLYNRFDRDKRHLGGYKSEIPTLSGFFKIK